MWQLPTPASTHSATQAATAAAATAATACGSSSCGGVAKPQAPQQKQVGAAAVDGTATAVEATAQATPHAAIKQAAAWSD